MAEPFIILERTGNGYLIKSTEGRDDQQFKVLTIRGALAVDSGTLEINTFLDAEEWVAIMGGARIMTPNTLGVYHGSTTATIRGVFVAVRDDTGSPLDAWHVFIDYSLADATDDVCDVVVYAGKTPQISRSNITNN